ncbi:MAG: proton-conducting transporter membrane subunit [Nitrospirota bacterium]
MIEWIHPGIVILLGAFLLPLLRNRKAKQAYFVLLPIAGLTILILTSMGVFGIIPPYPDALHKWCIPFLQYTLELGRIDKLSIIFAYVYVVIGLAMNIFALRGKKDWEHVSALIHIGSSVSAIFAGDLFTYIFFVEIAVWSAVFLIWFRGTKTSLGSGFRYFFWHVLAGAFFLGGSIIHVQTTGSIDLALMPWGWGWDYIGYYLMMLGLLIDAGSFPVHAWLPDAYSTGAVTGVLYVTAYSTKTGIYGLIRCFPGVELLMWLGVITAVFALYMAVLENDARRLCGYHIISQDGYMIAGAGIGTYLGLNGSVSHIICHIIYSCVLLMGASTVLSVTGTCKFSETGGLYKYFRISFWLYLIGGFSISGVPLFNGFVSKSMTIEAAELIHQPLAYLMLEGATVGTFLHTAIKLPWNLWFQGRKEPPADIKIKLKEKRENTPINMLIGMSIPAFLCVFIGVYPYYPFYDMLPWPVSPFVPYTTTRVFSMVQMFIFTFLAAWFLRTLIRGTPTYTLDSDWLGRIPGNALVSFCEKPLIAFGSFLDRNILKVTYFIISCVRSPIPEMRMTPRAIGLGALAVLALFSLFLIVYI